MNIQNQNFRVGQRPQAIKPSCWSLDPKQLIDAGPVAVYGPGKSDSTEQQQGPNYFMIGGPYQNYASPGSV